MGHTRTIFETACKTFRILEVPDFYCDLEDLKGDTFKIECCPEIPVEELRRQEIEFESLVEQNGVFGYVLEKWNPKAGIGYENVDSCFGFIGQFDETDQNFNHDIVSEFKELIQGELNHGK